MYLRNLVAAVAVALPAVAQAHDFWLMPRQFQVERPGGVRVLFNIGDAAKPEAWNLRLDKVVALRTFGPRDMVDQQAAIIPKTGEVAGFAAVSLTDPGTHLLTFESTQSVSELPADRFNKYVADEGLTIVAAQRTRAGTTAKIGRETYSRRAKALIQVGEPISDHVLKPIGLTLEIVPEKHPYALGDDRRLPVRVYFRGKPLPGALVSQIDLHGDGVSKAETRTDGDGRAVFTVPARSDWRLNVVWADAVTGNPQADFDTIFASLTFGYRAR